MTDRSLLVFVDLDGVLHRVGRLWARARKGKESAAFEYDASWLISSLRFALEPALMLGTGPHHTIAGQSRFGAIGTRIANFQRVNSVLILHWLWGRSPAPAGSGALGRKRRQKLGAHA